MEPERNDPLEAFFTAARGPAPVPDALMARVLADADQVQAAQVRTAPPVRRPDSTVAATGFWQRFVQVLGGSGAVAGLAAAGMAGVWLGFAQPVALPFTDSTVELIPADDDFWLALVVEPTPEG